MSRTPVTAVHCRPREPRPGFSAGHKHVSSNQPTTTQYRPAQGTSMTLFATLSGRVPSALFTERIRHGTGDLNEPHQTQNRPALIAREKSWGNKFCALKKQV